eukprot:3364119-Pyramimonas_sp.AAC.1
MREVEKLYVRRETVNKRRPSASSRPRARPSTWANWELPRGSCLLPCRALPPLLPCPQRRGRVTHAPRTRTGFGLL